MMGGASPGTRPPRGPVEEWRCSGCKTLLQVHYLPPGGYVQTKCWKCKRLVAIYRPLEDEGPGSPPD